MFEITSREADSTEPIVDFEPTLSEIDRVSDLEKFFSGKMA